MLDIDARDAARTSSLTQPPPGFIDDPDPVYALLREHDPCHELAPGSQLLTRHGDVLTVCRGPHTGSDKQAESAPRMDAGLVTSVDGLRFRGLRHLPADLG